MKCKRCSGKGIIAEYAHIRGGLCFKCNGTGKSKERQSSATPPNQSKIDESNRKDKRARELYKDDPRLRVAITHPYAYAHICELAQKDGIWDTL